MKREILFLLFLLTMPFVFALDINIAGVTLSLTTFFPLVIIAGAILFFFLLWLKDNYRTVLDKMVHFPRFGFQRAKKEIEKPPVDYLNELDKFEKKVPNLTVDASLKQFSGIVKDFFAYAFKIEREYTHTELETILMKHRKETLIPFSNKLAEIKYTNKILTQREFLKLTDEFKDIVRLTLGKKIKPTLLERVVFRGGYQYQKTILERLKETIDNINSNIKRTVRKEYFTGKIKFLEDFKLSNRRFIRNFIHATEETGHNFNLSIKYKLNNLSRNVEEATDNINLYFRHKMNNFHQVIENVNREINNRLRENKFKLTISGLNNLIEEGYRVSLKDTEKAKVIYYNALAICYKLPLTEQKKYSSLVLDLYNKIETTEREKKRIEIEKKEYFTGKIKFLEDFKLSNRRFIRNFIHATEETGHNFKLSNRRFIRNFIHATEETGHNFNLSIKYKTRRSIKNFICATNEVGQNFNLYIKHKLNNLSRNVEEATDNINLYFRHKMNNFHQVIENVNREINNRLRENKFKLTISGLNNLIEEGYRVSLKDTEKAKVIYYNALAICYKLPLTEQKKYSSLVLDLYNKIETMEREKERVEIEKLVQKVEELKRKHHPIPSRFSWLISNIEDTLGSLLEFRKTKKIKKGRNDILKAIREMFEHLVDVEQKGIHTLALKERHLVRNIGTILENAKLDIKKETAKLRKTIKIQVKHVEPAKLRVLKQSRPIEIKPIREEIPIPTQTIVAAALELNVEPKLETKVEAERIEKPRLKLSKDMRRLIKEEEHLSKKIMELEAA